MKETYYCHYDSPIGKLLLAGDKTQLTLLSFPNGSMARAPEDNWQFAPQYFANCIKQLDEYFAGNRTTFDLKYSIAGTNFMVSVLKEVANIPYGTTTSYGEIAEIIANPKAVRAVGMANARNNLPIIIPCHRVIAKNGALTGFGGGLATKKFLLDFEKEKIHERAS